MRARRKPHRSKPGHIYVGATELRRRRGRRLLVLLFLVLILAASIWLILGWDLAAGESVARLNLSVQMSRGSL
jgi:hypothetical protein